MSGHGATVDVSWRPPDDHELAAAWRAARGGAAGTLLLRGEAGAGKTSAVRRLSEAARAEGDTVILAACADVDDQLPFWPLATALAAVVSGSEDLPGPVRDVLAPHVRAVDALLETGDRGSAAGAGLETIRRTLVALSTAAPVLVVVEDLQWAERATRDAVAALVAHLRHEPVLLVVTVRGESTVEGHPLQALLRELVRHPRVRVHRLEPLPQLAVHRLVTQGGGDSALADLVWQRSAGNPFIVAETVRAARDGDPRRVPESLRELVLSRIHELSHPARSVVFALAVGQEPVAHRLLAAAAGLAEEPLVAALREAADRGVVVVDRSTDGYRLRHGLLRDVLLDELMPGERQALHRRYGEAFDVVVTGSTTRAAPDVRGPHDLTAMLDDLVADTDSASSFGPTTSADGERSHRGRAGRGSIERRVEGATALCRAQHWYLADDPARALGPVLLAAGAAENVRDHRTAHHQLIRAIELVERHALRGHREGGTSDDRYEGPGARASRALVLRAADAAHRCGEHDAAVELIRRLDPGTDVTITTRLGRYLLDAGRTPEAVAVLARPPAPAQSTSTTLASWHATRADALLASGDLRSAQRAAEQAVALARELGDAPEQAPMLATLGFALAYRENAEAGLAAVADGLRIAERAGDPGDIGNAYRRWADLLTGPLNEIAEGVEIARQGAIRMRELGLARTLGVHLLATSANGLFRLGRWSEAQDAVDEADALGPSGAEALETRLAQIRLRVGRGEFPAAEDDLGAVELLSVEAGERRRIPLLTLRSGLHMWRGHPGEARALVATGLDLVADTPDDVFLIAPLLWHGLRAEAECRTAPDTMPDPAAVRRLVECVDDLDRRLPHIVPALRRTVAAYVRMCRAELGRVRGTPAPEAWRTVAEQWSRLLNPYPAAYAQLRRADALLEVGRRPTTEVRACLSAAAGAGARMGATPFLAEVAAVAERARLDLGELLPTAADRAPRPASGPELSALTPREHQVLETIAEGLSNREIAHRLAMRERTVAVHVSNLLRKTDTRSRTQAAALWQRVHAR